MSAPIETISEKHEPSLSDKTTLNTLDIDLEAGSVNEKWINLGKFKKEDTLPENSGTSLDKYNEKGDHREPEMPIEPNIESATLASKPSALTAARVALTAVGTQLILCATKRRRCWFVFTRDFSWGRCFGIRHGDSICHPFTWIVLPLTYLIPFGTLMFLMFGLPILLDKRSPEEKKAAAQQAASEWNGSF